MTTGGTDTLAVQGLVFGVVIVIVFVLLALGVAAPFRILSRFWSGPSDE